MDQSEIAKQTAAELPNIITLVYSSFSSSQWAIFLHHYENTIFSLVTTCLLASVFYLGSRHAKLIPSGLQNFLEWVVEGLQNLINEVLGSEGDKYLPLLGTLFIYILTMNWLGIVPFMKAPSSNINTTIALAICVFLLVQYLNFKNMGLLGFIYHLAGSPKGFAAWALAPLMFPIELITQISRPITLALRLCGNIMGEEIMIAAFALLGIQMFVNWMGPLILPLQTPFMFLAILSSLMQALVFTLLSAVYILLSRPHQSNHSDQH